MNESKAILPNFLIIGAAKSGTNSLAEYLRQHPQAFIPAFKEPCFFAYEGHPRDNPWDRPDAITDYQTYLNLFASPEGKIAIGESSPVYLISPQAPHKIKKYIPNANLIAILRHPADRAYSQWQMEIRHGHEQMDFQQAVRVMEKLQDGNIRQRYIFQGYYYQQLKRYYELFGRSQLLVIILEDLIKNPIALAQRMYTFLGIDPTFQPDVSIRQNEGGIPRNRIWDWFFSKLLPRVSNLRARLPTRTRERVAAVSGRVKAQGLTKPPPLSPSLRAELTELFHEDILQLQGLIQTDLSSWLENKQH